MHLTQGLMTVLIDNTQQKTVLTWEYNVKSEMFGVVLLII